MQDITREHFNHDINRANQFYIADMQIMSAENRGKPQDRSYKHRILTNPVEILRFLNRTIWCDCYLNIRANEILSDLHTKLSASAYSKVLAVILKLRFMCVSIILFSKEPRPNRSPPHTQTLLFYFQFQDISIPMVAKITVCSVFYVHVRIIV